jgi:hypothetical protein
MSARRRQGGEDADAVALDTADKLDRIREDVHALSVSVANLAGDVRSLVSRQERHDTEHDVARVEGVTTMADIERRIRQLERRSYAIPSLAAVLGVAGFAVALWSLIAGGHV